MKFNDIKELIVKNNISESMPLTNDKKEEIMSIVKGLGSKKFKTPKRDSDDWNGMLLDIRKVLGPNHKKLKDSDISKLIDMIADEY